MNDVLKRNRQSKGPSPMGTTSHKGTMGSGGREPVAKGAVGSGKAGGGTAKGTMGRGK